MIEPKGTRAITTATATATTSSQPLEAATTTYSTTSTLQEQSGRKSIAQVAGDKDDNLEGSKYKNGKERDINSSLSTQTATLPAEAGILSLAKQNTLSYNSVPNDHTISAIGNEGIRIDQLEERTRGRERVEKGDSLGVAENEQMRSRCIESFWPLPQSISEHEIELHYKQRSEQQQQVLNEKSTPEVWKRFQSGSCRLLTDPKLSAPDREFAAWSADCNTRHLSGNHLNCKLLEPSLRKSQEVSVSVKSERNDLEVQWSSSGLLKKAFHVSSGDSRSSSIKTSLVNSLKAGKSSFQRSDAFNRTIKGLVDHFRSPDYFGQAEGQKQQPTSSKRSSERKSCNENFNNDSSRLINSNLNVEESKERSVFAKPVSSLVLSKVQTSVSSQELAQNRHKLCQMRQASETREEDCEETFKVRGRGRGREVANSERLNNQQSLEIESNIIPTKQQVTTSTRSRNDIDNNNNNMTNESCISKNKYIVEDKLRKQQQTTTRCNDARLENRRSTYCSSVGATSDMNYDSSFSSVNNCSESNNTCAMVRQYSRDFADRKDCKHPVRTPAAQDGGEGGDGNGDDPNQGSHVEGKIKKHRQAKCDEKFKKRENWDKNIEFLLAVIGFAVDLGNVWRFPYICYKNGGGAFLIPYTIMFILGGLPIFYLEMSLGQYFSSGCLTVWKRVCPMAKGIGYAMCVLNFFTGLYYNTIISWAVFFFVESFTQVLPWTNCNNLWNSINCRTIDQRQALKQINLTYTPLSDQQTTNQTTLDHHSHQQQQQQVYYSSPTKDYFEREVLQIHLSTGIDDLGYIRKPLAIYLAIVFVCIYFAIWKGVKSTGKAVWITALLPYFVLIPLLIRGVFLEGAWLGIKYYLYPQWVKIIDVDVWVEAAKQIYFSLGPGFGTLMALSSYNKFNHNCSRDTLIAASVNYFASFISGLVIFAVLGYMATIENVDISDVATEGPGLVFQVYPEGLATMSFSSMWSVLFFIMVITLGIDSTFGGLESVITGLCDEYPRLLRAHRGIFIGILIILIYLCSLPTTTYGGNYVIYVLESYGTSLSLLFIVLIETIIVCWLYGADRFCGNLEEMYGKMPGAYWRICWKYISPTILLIIFVAACLQELDKYHTLTNGDYTYPSWAPTVGLLMTGSSVCCIPVYAIYYLKTKTSGSFLERLKIACKPIEGDFRTDKGIYVDALTDKIRDENDIHLDTVI